MVDINDVISCGLSVLLSLGVDVVV